MKFLNLFKRKKKEVLKVQIEIGENVTTNQFENLLKHLMDKGLNPVVKGRNGSAQVKVSGKDPEAKPEEPARQPEEVVEEVVEPVIQPEEPKE